MNLIYICVFFNKDYIKLLDLLIKSINTNGNINTQTTDILIVTSSTFKPLIENITNQYFLSFKLQYLNVSTLFDAASARLKIFDYTDINLNLYENILYLDTDILINNDLNIIFNLDIDGSKIYALEEGNIGHEYWGSQFFDFKIYNQTITAFSSGILLFKNTPEIQNLIKQINQHINNFIRQNNHIPICLEQPFIVYNSIINNQYNNTLLKSYVENNPSNVKDNIVIYHFPGGPGDYNSKTFKMNSFYPKLIKREYINLINQTKISKIFFQTAKTQLEPYITELIKSKLTSEWQYYFFNDEDIINFYNDNPIDDLPDIIAKHNSLKNGAHRADLFRYYYLYVKGGFFMDSDAMIYENIDNILKNYEFVSVNSSTHPKNIFQGILGTTAGNEIIKNALYLAYNTDINILNNNYHYYCKQLYNIINNSENNYSKKYKIKLYKELRKPNKDYDEILNDENKIIFKHYWKNKIIPMETNLSIEPSIKSPKSIDSSNSNGIIVPVHEELDLSKMEYFNTKYGKLYLNKYDKYFCDVFRNNKYWDEDNLYKLRDNYIPNNRNILEIGGHSGTSTLFYAKHMELDTGIIYTFEPQKNMFEILKKNIVINNLNNKVKLFNTAIFCKNGTITMNDNDVDGLVKGNIKLLEKQNKNINYGGVCIGSNGEEVNCITLDNNDLDLNNIGFIHCDAQGAEPYIFSCAKELIKKHRPVILYENMNLYGDYLFNIIKNNYPEYHENSQFDIKSYCVNELGYYCIDNFNKSNFDSLLIPYKYTDWNNYNKAEIHNFDFRVLITYKVPMNLKRIGANTDGGYVIADGLNYDLFISCGIAGDINFEDCFLDLYKNIECYAFDGTINKIPNHRNNIKWINKNIGYLNTPKTTNLQEYIQNNKNIFLKMDIEGSEFNWLDSMSIENLDKFTQIVLEVHWPFDKYRCDMLAKLNETHYIIHIHGNNYCDRDIPKHLPSGRTYDGTVLIKNKDLPEIKLPEVIEITYINKNLCKNLCKDLYKNINISKEEIKFPTILDYPNNPRAEDIKFSIPVI